MESCLPETNSSFPDSYWIELLHYFRKSLIRIKNLTRVSQGKFIDRRFGEYYHRSINDDILKVDDVLQQVLNYVLVSTPVRKKGTVHTLIEEVLRKHRTLLESKGFEILKVFEENLPEAIIPDPQLQYLLNVLLFLAAAAIPSNGRIEISTHSLPPSDQAGGRWPVTARQVGITIRGSGDESEPGIRDLQKEEASHLLLRLVEEIVKRNRGTLEVGKGGRKAGTLVHLRFPVERREVVRYEPVHNEAEHRSDSEKSGVLPKP